MEAPARAVLLLAVALLILLPNALVLGRHVAQATYLYERQHQTANGIAVAVSSELEKKRSRHGKPYTIQIAGSKLPDCSHACGSCSPCRLVMVSLVCATIQEAETCPMAYKCMCNSKAYPVP